MTALQSWRNFIDPKNLEPARAFYANQATQGQQQGGVGGFLQQALGNTVVTGMDLRQAAINTVLNWDTQAYIREAQTFYSGQVAAGQKEGGVTGFFQQGLGYTGGALASLPGLATQISPAIDQGLDWFTAQRQQINQQLVNQTRNIPVLGALTRAGVDTVEHQLQFSTGALKGAGSMVGGIAQMVTNPVDTLKGLYTMGENLPTLPGMPNTFRMLSATGDVLFRGADPQKRFDSVFNQNVVNQEMGQFWGNAANSFMQPYQQAINEGKPMEAVGRGAFEVASFFLGGGAAAKAGKVSRVADAAGDLSRVANVADDASDLSRVGRVADAASDLSRVGRGTGMLDNLDGLL
jgi:hypothetical protein